VEFEPYRAHHSTETAVLRVLSDILLALDSGDIAVLTLLDVSAAFDSVDHSTLLQQLQTSYGLGLVNRTQCVRLPTTRSAESAVLYGVPQGSVLFLLYTADLLQLIRRHHHPHAYAEDTQIYGFCHPSEAGMLQHQLSTCVDEVAYWMMSNRLQLNHSKTEVLWCASSRRQHQLLTGPVRIGNTSVMPVTAVQDLGVHLDADLTTTHT